MIVISNHRDVTHTELLSLERSQTKKKTGQLNKAVSSST